MKAKAKKCIYENTYWTGKGRHPKLVETLTRLVPVSGAIKNADDNPALERFRVAANCYYDLYNNGLCNLSWEFEMVFGFAAGAELTPGLVRLTERAMDRIILSAAKEQRVGKK